MRLLLLFCLLILPINQSFAGMEPGTCSSGSVHDMNYYLPVQDDQYLRVCVFCHTPHNAQPGGGPIWARWPTDPSGWAAYTWAAPSNNAILQITDPLVGPSRLCMSCHDGVNAIDAHGTNMIGYGVFKNKDLSNTHPIGFSYDDAMNVRGGMELVDKDQYLPTSITVSETAGVYNQVARNGSRKVSDVLYQGKIMTCSSCHEVHNCANVKPDPGHSYNYLLWAKLEQSLICLSCHLK